MGLYNGRGLWGVFFFLPYLGVVLRDFYFEVLDGGGSELFSWGHVLGAFAFCGFPPSPLKTLHTLHTGSPLPGCHFTYLPLLPDWVLIYLRAITLNTNVVVPLPCCLGVCSLVAGCLRALCLF